MFPDIHSYDLSQDALIKKIKSGAVSAPESVQLLNKIVYSLPGEPDGSVAYTDIENAFDKMGIDLQDRLNMAEAILNDPRNKNTPLREQSLLILSQTLGVQQDMEQLAATQVQSYESPENIAHLNTEWSAAFGSGSYTEAMEKLKANALNDAEKKQLLRFENVHYAKHLGVDPAELEFYSDNPNSKGWNNGQGKIGINQNTPEYAQDPLSTLGTIRHEATHTFQGSLAKTYESGALDNAPDKVRLLGQLFSVGLRSYVTPYTDFGAYANQPVEVHCKGVNNATENNEKYRTILATFMQDGPQFIEAPVVPLKPSIIVEVNAKLAPAA